MLAPARGPVHAVPPAGLIWSGIKRKSAKAALGIKGGTASIHGDRVVWTELHFAAIVREEARYSMVGYGRTDGARLLSVHLTASVFIGSTSSHIRQTNFVRPVLSVIAIRRFLHFGHRLESIEVS